MMISNLNLANLPECVCEMRYIDSALLTPCAEYQRVLRTRKVEEISATFSEYVANEPRVSYRDGRYHVFDGQNTIEARIACNGGHDLPILCKVFHGLCDLQRLRLSHQPRQLCSTGAPGREKSGHRKNSPAYVPAHLRQYPAVQSQHRCGNGGRRSRTRATQHDPCNLYAGLRQAA